MLLKPWDNMATEEEVPLVELPQVQVNHPTYQFMDEEMSAMKRNEPFMQNLELLMFSEPLASTP